METTHLEAAVSRRALLSLVSQLTGGYPNPDDPQPPGPWDPVIRRALERVGGFDYRPEPWRVFGPFPDPWRSAASALDRLSRVALNPQPLPPRFALAAALAQEMIDRTRLLYELVEAFPDEMQGHVQEAAGSRLAQFVDDICGNDMRWWPAPVPPSNGDGAPESIGADELVVMGVQFERTAGTLANERLQRDFARAGARLIEVGLERMH